MIQKLAFACLRDLDGHEYGRRPPSQLTVGDKLNEVIEAVNVHITQLALLGTPVVPMQTYTTAGTAPPGFRTLHIEDGQVQEDVNIIPSLPAPEWHGLSNGHGHRLDPSISVPEAEPQEQELPEADLEEHSRISADFARAIADVELAAIRAYVVQDTPSLHHQKSQQLDTARRVLFAAAHREYAQPGQATCEDYLEQLGQYGHGALKEKDAAAQSGKDI